MIKDSPIDCPKALLQKKVVWCTAVDNYCAWQKHCYRRGHAILTEEAKTCKLKEPPEEKPVEKKKTTRKKTTKKTETETDTDKTKGEE